MRILFVIIISLAIFSCKSSQKTVDAVPPEASDIIISMRKTPCYGTCPAYELQIYGDLTVKLKGERFLDLIGEFESTISEARMDQLRKAFEAADFFAFEDEYTGNVTDLPTTYLFFDDGNESKQVKDYYMAPETLKELEREVAKLLDELEWKPVDK